MNEAIGWWVVAGVVAAQASAGWVLLAWTRTRIRRAFAPLHADLDRLAGRLDRLINHFDRAVGRGE